MGTTFGYEWERVGTTNGNSKLGTPLISILRILHLVFYREGMSAPLSLL